MSSKGSSSSPRHSRLPHTASSVGVRGREEEGEGERKRREREREVKQFVRK